MYMVSYLSRRAGTDKSRQQLCRQDEQRPLVPEHLQHVHQRVCGVRAGRQGGREMGVPTTFNSTVNATLQETETCNTRIGQLTWY